MVKPDMEMKDFMRIYKDGRRKLNIGDSSGSRLYNYIKEKGDKKYFIGLNKKLRLGNMNNVKGRTFFISIQNKIFFNSSHGLIDKLINLKPQNCFISMDIGKVVFIVRISLIRGHHARL